MNRNQRRRRKVLEQREMDPVMKQFLADSTREFGDNFYFAMLMHMDDDMETGIVHIDEYRSFPDHQSAIDAITADFGAEKFMWTRIDWTAVSGNRVSVIARVSAGMQVNIGPAHIADDRKQMPLGYDWDAPRVDSAWVGRKN